MEDYSKIYRVYCTFKVALPKFTNLFNPTKPCEDHTPDFTREEMGNTRTI